jgi:hypothetical protein
MESVDLFSDCWPGMQSTFSYVSECVVILQDKYKACNTRFMSCSEATQKRTPDLGMLLSRFFFVPQEVNWQPHDASCNLL